MTAPLLALSVQHPWALALALGLKPVENRDWRYPPPRHVIGARIALHASKAVPDDAEETIMDLLYGKLWPSAHPECDLDEAVDDDVGRILVECHRTAGCILAVATLDRVIQRGDGDPLNDDRWRSCDRFGLVFRDVVRLAESVPCRGMLGFWAVPIVPAEAVRRQLARAGRAA